MEMSLEYFILQIKYAQRYLKNLNHSIILYKIHWQAWCLWRLQSFIRYSDCLLKSFINNVQKLFDKKPASKNPWTKEIWIHDFRTNIHFVLKKKQMKFADYMTSLNIITRRTDINVKRHIAKAIQKVVWENSTMKKSSQEITRDWISSDSKIRA